MLPNSIEQIIERFDQNNIDVYLVGGWVRDFLLGKPAKDYDMTTPLLPDEILSLFPDYTSFSVGKKYGTIGLLTDQGIVEITTYRVDGPYLDNRKPREVDFTGDLTEDLSRRDFRMNAMAYHPKKGLVDPFKGQEDLKNKVIRSVGSSQKRFQEDGLRILRSIRFMGQLGFSLDKEVEEAIKGQGQRIASLSPERIFEEMEKILLQDKPSFPLQKMVELGIMDYIFPELLATVGFDQRVVYHDKTLFDHILCVVDACPRNLSLRIAALFHDIEKPNTLSIDEKTGRGHFFGHDSLGAEKAAEILKNYHQSKKRIREVSTLIHEHMKWHDPISDKALRRQIKRVGKDLIFDLYDLMAADMSCTAGARSVDWLEERKNRIRGLMEDGSLEKSSLPIGGEDIIGLGVKEGPLIGVLLKEVEELVLDDPKKNTRKILLDYIKRRIGEINSED